MSKTSNSKYLLGAVFFIFLSFSFVRSSLDVLKSRNRLDELKEEVALLEQKELEIKKEIEYKETEDYIEEKARNDLNLIKPGEKVYVAVGGENSSGNVLSESTVNEEKDKRDSNWYSWYRLFFDN